MDVERIYREESPRILATLIRLLGDFELAEDAMQESFAAALVQWPVDGMPANPRAWLVGTGRHKALDILRRRRRWETSVESIAQVQDAAQIASGTSGTVPGTPGTEDPTEGLLEDDRLRLIFTCCHPALSLEAQVPLTLRTLCGLSTEHIARAFLVPVPTMAQRLVRATNKIRAAGIPYRVPEAEVLEERLEAVLVVVYLVFNEGYAATAGDALVRPELCHEAIRLGRLLCELMPEPSEVRGLLALMLIQDSRRHARVDGAGDIVLLEDQDRTTWDVRQIAEGTALVEAALREGEPGPYVTQAAIAAQHAKARRAEETDWGEICRLYERLMTIHPSPVVALNHAVAIGMREGPAQGLARLDDLAASGRLRGYHLLHAARADMLRRLGRGADAAEAYRRALALVVNEPERRFLQRRLEAIEGRGAG